MSTFKAVQVAIIVYHWLFDSSYHGLNQRHADLLVLNIGGVQADGDHHHVKYVEGVLLHFQSGTLKTVTENIFEAQHLLMVYQC